MNPSNGSHSQGIDMQMITCIVQRGRADKVARAAMKGGAGGATVSFARGMGVRERLGLLGLAIVPEKEVIMIVCTKEQVDPLLKMITEAADLNTPGHGIAYVMQIHQVVGLFPAGEVVHADAATG